MDELIKQLQKAEQEACKIYVKNRMDALKNPGEKRKISLPSECKTSLEWFRKAKGLTQAKLSEESGVNLRTLQDYEQGRKDINKVAGITLYKLAQALECNVEDLLEFKKEVEE